MRWCFSLTEPADGARNMALDHALMRRAAARGDAVFRVYSWSAPTLSLGRNQTARGCYDEPEAQRLGIAFVRRPTGGRALLHHREVTYSATLPAARGGGPRRTYDFINDILLGALRQLGIAAGRPETVTAAPPGPRPCFDAPAAHEITLQGRKLVGSAQWSHDGALLQHGSILVRDDQPVIARLLRPATPQPPPAAATLADALGFEPDIAQVAEPLLESLKEATGRRPDPLVLDDVLETDAALLRRRYTDAAWTWRR